MSRIAVFGNAGNETNRSLVAAWRAVGLDAGFDLDDAEVVVGRIDVRPSLDGLEPGLLELAALARSPARILNRPAAILRAHDKLLTARTLARAGVPHPRTALLRPGDPVPFAPPFVLKPRFGSWGRDVFRCDSLAAERVALGVLASREWFRRQGAIVQELVPPVGYDLRALVADGRVVGCVERVAAPGEWRTNVSLGGTRRPARPPAAAVELALAAVGALGGDFFGVDLLPADGGHVVLEANAAADFDETYSLGPGDVHAEIAAALGFLGAAAAAVAAA